MHSDKTLLRPAASSSGNRIAPSSQFTAVIEKLPIFRAVNRNTSARMGSFDA
jgi:hypothetical protein